MKTKSVIIVEDSSIIRDLVTRAFSHKENINVHSFSNGEDMLKEISEKPDLIVLDYYLDASDKKAKNGLEILKELSAKFGIIPTIILSGMTDESKLEEIRRYGVLDFINKAEDDIFEEIENLSSKYLMME